MSNLEKHPVEIVESQAPDPSTGSGTTTGARITGVEILEPATCRSADRAR